MFKVHEYETVSSACVPRDELSPGNCIICYPVHLSAGLISYKRCYCLQLHLSNKEKTLTKT